MTKDRRVFNIFDNWTFEKQHHTKRCIELHPEGENIAGSFRAVEIDAETEKIYKAEDVEMLLEALRFYANIANPFPKQLDSDNEEIGHELDNDYTRGGKRARQALEQWRERE